MLVFVSYALYNEYQMRYSFFNDEIFVQIVLCLRNGIVRFFFCFLLPVSVFFPLQTKRIKRFDVAPRDKHNDSVSSFGGYKKHSLYTVKTYHAQIFTFYVYLQPTRAKIIYKVSRKKSHEHAELSSK